MYTQNFLKVFHFVLYLPNLVGSFPVNVDPKRVTFYMSEKSKSRNTRATLLFLFVVMPFYLFRTWEIWAWKGGNSNKYFHLCYAISFVAVMETITLLHIRWKRDEISVAFSRMVRSCKRFEGKGFLKLVPIFKIGLYKYLRIFCEKFLFNIKSWKFTV